MEGRIYIQNLSIGGMMRKVAKYYIVRIWKRIAKEEVLEIFRAMKAILELDVNLVMFFNYFCFVFIFIMNRLWQKCGGRVIRRLLIIHVRRAIRLNITFTWLFYLQCGHFALLYLL